MRMMGGAGIYQDPTVAPVVHIVRGYSAVSKEHLQIQS